MGTAAIAWLPAPNPRSSRALSCSKKLPQLQDCLDPTGFESQAAAKGGSWVDPLAQSPLAQAGFDQGLELK